MLREFSDFQKDFSRKLKAHYFPNYSLSLRRSWAHGLQVISFTHGYLELFVGTFAATLTLNSTHALSVWRPPNSNTIKINFDVAPFEYTDDFRARVITQNSEGKSIRWGPYDYLSILSDFFYDIVHAADRVLWSGCTQSHLASVTGLIIIKAEGNNSKQTYDQICEWGNNILSRDHTLLRDYYNTKKLIRDLSLPIEKIDACKTGCMFYWKNDVDLEYYKFYRDIRYKLTSPNFQSQSAKNKANLAAAVTVYRRGSSFFGRRKRKMSHNSNAIASRLRYSRSAIKRRKRPIEQPEVANATVMIKILNHPLHGHHRAIVVVVSSGRSESNRVFSLSFEAHHTIVEPS
ncbi:hypothetical protein Sango_2303600 [Sesamum angolense]|uniref:Uncharacterized protein n=1 Tax=Sesamum angolense TaxID=2727404 RepID=A0AAE1WAC7_9LAMI|nr:hypothetical protein Sango_2303600 [Sesamum angolense]